MAVKKDQEFKIKITVEDKATKGFKSLQGATVDYSDMTEAMRHEIDRAIGSLEMVKVAVAQASKEYQSASMHLGGYNESVKKASVQTAGVTSAVEKSTGAFSSFSGGLNDAAASASLVVFNISNTLSAIRDFIHLIIKLSDPKVLAQLSKIMYVLSVVAKIKGYGGVSDQLREASGRVGQLSIEVERLGGIFETELDRMVFQSKVFYTVIDTIEVSAKAALGALIALTASGIIGGFTSLAKNAGIIDRSLLELTKNMGRHTEGIMAGVMAVNTYLDNLLRVNVSKVAKTLALRFGSVFAGALSTSLSGSFAVGFKTVSASMALLGGSIGRASTVGAQQIGILRVASIDLGAAFEILRTRVAGSMTTLLSTVTAGVGSATKSFGVFAKGFREGFISPLTAGAQAAKTLDVAALGAATNAARVAGATASFKGLTAATVTLTEAGTLVAPMLAAIGVAMASADSTFIKFVGTVSIVAATLLGGFAAVVTVTLGKIGRLAIAIGDTLINAMAKWEAKASKMEAITNRFRFTIEGFGRELGQNFVGSVGDAEAAIEEMMSNSTVHVNDLRSSFNLLTAEGAVLGIDFAEKIKIMERALDASASTGEEYKDIVLKINSALMGQGQGLANLGINLQQSGVAHSKYLKELGKEYNQLTENEKVQARLYELYKQTNPMLGAAAAQMETIEGATARYTQALELLQAELGRQNIFTVAYLNIFRELATLFMQMPKAIVAATGALIDFGGVFLKVSGVILANVAVVLSLTTIWGILLGLIQSNAMAQNVLTVAMAALGGVVNVQTVQVTGLATAWANMRVIMAGSLKVVLATVGSLLLTLTKRVLMLTAAMLTNPIFLAAAAITAGVVLVYKAFKELTSEIGFLGDSMDSIKGYFKGLTGDTNILTAAWNGLKSVVGSLYTVLVNFTKFIITGLLSAMLLMVKAGAKVIRMFTKSEESVRALDLYTEELDERIKVLGRSAGSSLAGIANAFESSAIAAESAGETYKKAVSEIVKFRMENSAISAMLDKDSVVVGVWGDKYAQANQRVSELSVAAGNALSAYRNLKASGTATAEQIKEAWDNSAKATHALAQAYEELKKIRSDTFTDLEAQTRDLAIEQLKNEGKLVEAAKRELDFKLEAFDKEMEALQKIYNLRKDELAIINKSRGAIEREGAAQIEAAREDEIKRGQEQAGKGAILFDKSQIQTIESALGESTAAFASGMSSAASGIMGAVAAAQMIVDAIQTLIDFIPNFINSVAKLFNSLTDLPAQITKAFANLWDSISNFVENFLPNIIDGIGDVLMGALDFIVEGLPRAMENLATKLPEALTRLIERLPEMATKLGMAIFSPKVLITMTKTLLMAMPKLVAGLVNAIPAIIVAFVDGFILAGKEFINMLADFFGMGEIFNIDMGNITEKVQDMGDAIAKSASKLFEVVDMTAEMRGMDMADRIGEAIKSAMWDVLAWLRGLWDKMIKWLSKVGQWIWDGLKEAISKAWEWIKTMGAAVWEGLKGAFMAAWQLIKDIGGGIWEGLKEAIGKAWEWIKTMGAAIWEGLKAAFDGAKKIFTNLGQWIWGGLKEGLASAGTFLYDIGKKIWDGLWSGLKGLGAHITGVFDGLNPKNFFERIFKVDGKGTGKVEKALGIDVPYANFALGGVVGGQAVVRGDSPLNDKILALVSAGEAIIPRSKMADPNTSRLVGQILDGDVPEYSMVSAAIKRNTGGGAKVPSLSSALGSLTNNVSVGNFTEGMKSGWDSLEGGAKSAWDDTYAEAKRASKHLQYLNPEYLWKQVYTQVMSGIWKMVEANKFQEGGFVADYGLAEKGEYVMKRSAVNSIGLNTLTEMNAGVRRGNGGGVTIQKIEINARTNLDADSIRREVFPEIAKQLRRATQDGQFIISQRGVRA